MDGPGEYLPKMIQTPGGRLLPAESQRALDDARMTAKIWLKLTGG